MNRNVNGRYADFPAYNSKRIPSTKVPNLSKYLGKSIIYQIWSTQLKNDP